ncbi:prepilin peptidase [Escherichia coli]|nr:prepilin peptidase [Escherichia coli]EER1224117.1 prepilin peptidase [Escherichia coli]EER7968108.1 prepilin peptidase [Escherichia coli]EES4281918.1 prepilin peptidase [Escherichia coli]EES9029869.1 prepilin peptidase [Escherichia coli]
MLFDVFQQYPAAMPILATVGGLIIGSFLNVVIWRYPIMLRQQMAEFHGEMPSAQSKISLALPRSHCPHCQQTIRIRDNIPLLSWLIAASVIDLDHQWLPDVFTQGVLWTGLIAAWAQQSPLTLQDAVTGVLVGFIAFYSLRWIAGVVLRKEALGMGDVLLFAALGSWVGPLSLPNVALIASCCGLIYAVITKRGSTTLPFGPCLSLGGIATIYLQALF